MFLGFRALEAITLMIGIDKEVIVSVDLRILVAPRSCSLSSAFKVSNSSGPRDSRNFRVAQKDNNLVKRLLR